MPQNNDITEDKICDCGRRAWGNSVFCLKCFEDIRRNNSKLMKIKGMHKKGGGKND